LNNVKVAKRLWKKRLQRLCKSSFK